MFIYLGIGLLVLVSRFIVGCIVYGRKYLDELTTIYVLAFIGANILFWPIEVISWGIIYSMLLWNKKLFYEIINATNANLNENWLKDGSEKLF